MKKIKAARTPHLWQWISLRMISLALIAIVFVEGGMWFRFFWWITKLRRELPEDVREEFRVLEIDPVGNSDRLREMYGYYLYGDFFAPEALRSDLIFFTLLVLIALPLIIAGGIFVSLRLSRQLSAVAVSAKQIANSDFKSRAIFAPNTPAPLHAFVEDFNHMAERLERNERELQESSAAIAHELRTPLTAAKARLQGLIDGVFEPSPQQLNTIMKQLNQLNILIDDLYLLSLATAGQLVLNPSQFALKPLLEERLAWAVPHFQQRPMEISCTCGDNIFLTADRDRIGQALSIVIDNALRYAYAGNYIGLHVSKSEKYIVISIEDAGPGFNPKDVERACERFWRGEKSRSRHAGGSGLGLSVAAAICQAHNGFMSAHNRLTGGAQLRIELPYSE